MPSTPTHPLGPPTRRAVYIPDALLVDAYAKLKAAGIEPSGVRWSLSRVVVLALEAYTSDVERTHPDHAHAVLVASNLVAPKPSSE